MMKIKAKHEWRYNLDLIAKVISLASLKGLATFDNVDKLKEIAPKSEIDFEEGEGARGGTVRVP